MAKLPQKNPIERVLEDRVIELEFRPYLGLSQLGHECPRYLWYYWRWAFRRTISPRGMRIFERGNLEEERIYRDLINAKFKVTGLQDRIVKFWGHVQGHIDGILLEYPGDEETPYLLEIKTMKASSFNTLKSKKSIRDINLQYYIQAQLYMKYLELTKCLFIVTNKDTEERYYEVVEYNERILEGIEDKILSIFDSTQIPDKIGDSTWWKCRMCDAKEVCQQGEPAQKNCRTCESAEIREDGVWFCSKLNKELPEELQKEGCDEYIQLKILSK